MGLRFAILLSGRGSNMMSIADLLDDKRLDSDIALVAADQPCAGLAFASERGFEARLISYAERAKSDSEAELAQAIEEAEVDYILLAGFMRVLSADFVSRFEGRIINIHPSLLPKYKGLNTHQRALDAGDSHHGVSVHIVTAGLDDGPIIAQDDIPIEKDDDEMSLAARLLPCEHALYARVITSLITGDLAIENGQPRWQNRENKAVAD